MVCAVFQMMMFLSYDRLVEPAVVEHAENPDSCG